MAFTIPDKGEGQSNNMSILFQEDIDILVDGRSHTGVVLHGCAVTAQGSPNMTVAVAAGSVMTQGTLKAVTAGNATIGTADGTHPRIDIVVVNSSGSVAVRAGTAAASPFPPARTSGDVALAFVYVPASDTTISTNQITDKRVMRGYEPAILYKTTAKETTNTTNSAVHILNKSGSGVLIPAGLLTNPAQLRCEIGGNILLNSGSPTLTLIIKYGATSLFQDVTGSAIADSDRMAFSLRIIINALDASSQAFSGVFAASQVGTKTAPNTGYGDISAPPSIVNTPISFDVAVDSTVDQTLSVTLTMSVSNVANEIVVYHASLELI